MSFKKKKRERELPRRVLRKQSCSLLLSSMNVLLPLYLFGAGKTAKKQNKTRAWKSGFGFQVCHIARGLLVRSTAWSHDRLKWNFLGTLRVVKTSFMKQRWILGGRKRWSSVRPDLGQLCSLLFFGGAVHEVLQQPRSEGIALNVQHCAGAVTGDRRAVLKKWILEMTSSCNILVLVRQHAQNSQRLCTHTSQSTARIREMSLVGSPTASRMMARVNTPPAGIPAAPTLDAVAVTLTRTK